MPAGPIYLVPGDLSAQLDELRARGLHPKPAMEVIAENFVGRVNEEWDTAGHGTWQKLAPSTIAKRRKGKGKGEDEILKDSGRAAASPRPEATDFSAEAATDVSYMVFHVSDAPRTIIPLRNPFDIPQDAFDEATEMLVEWVAGQ